MEDLGGEFGAGWRAVGGGLGRSGDNRISSRGVPD
jgi:hypothetical protein